MRNPLKRLARPDQPKRPLRERLAGAKTKLVAVREKYGRTLRVHRALNAPLPIPAPAVDRVALVNYATFLALERDRVCAELYPHMGAKGTRFVLGLNEAWGFFFEGNNGTTDRKGLPPASTRALSVLDHVGIDWRKDATESDRAYFDDAARADTSERPALPHGWPGLDAELTEALDDMERLDAAQAAIYEAGNQDREGDTVPGYDALEDARGDAIRRLSTLRARGLPGLQAKAHAMLNSTLRGVQGPFEDIAESLARDLIGARPSVLDQHRPDPTLVAIEETKRLAAAYASACHAEPEAEVAVTAAGRAMFEHWQNVTLKTVPSTGAGVTALARYAIAFHREQGEPQDGEFEAILSAIARSPMRA